MTDAELLTECKKGLNVSMDSTELDGILKQKMLAVKHFMLNAGVTINQLESGLGLAVLTLGVGDLWNLTSGDVKFSSVFYILLTQLQAQGECVEE